MNKKFFLGLFLFSFVFVSFIFALKGDWFWVDDLGVILNGLINKFSDIGRIFTEDSRNYATTYNYNLPKSNFISGFLRPMQQIFFSVIHYLFGTNVLAYQVQQAFFHAANTFLLYLIFCNWIPISISFFGALFFAFYPSMGWMGWICTLQHFITLFFLLISIPFYIPLLKKKNFFKHSFFYFSGLFFLFSLLSRENHIFLAGWAMLGVFLFLTNKKEGFFARVKISFFKTSIFFISTLIYFLMKIYAFGFGTLTRTINNLFIRIPFLEKLFGATTKAKPIVSKAVKTVASTPAAAKTIEKVNFVKTNVFEKILNRFFAWVEIIFNTRINTFTQKFLAVCLIALLTIFLVIAYKRNKKLLAFLALGMPLFVWPCILLYPAHRYMNAIYPLLIFIIALGIANFLKQIKSKKLKTVFLASLLISSSAPLIQSYKNHIVLPALATRINDNYKNFRTFCKENKFLKNKSIILISSLDESDAEQMLQVAANDFSIKLAHIVISKLAHKGQYGFTEDYKISGVKYSVKNIHNGYRFTSEDKNHCGWTFHSYQPVKWSEEERAYVLAKEFFKEKKWYRFSMGKFFIHEITNKKYVTDVTFVFDEKWITPNTIFICWNTEKGKYVRI